MHRNPTVPLVLVVLLLTAQAQAQLVPSGFGEFLDRAHVHFPCLNKSVGLGACEIEAPARMGANGFPIPPYPEPYMGWDTANQYLGAIIIALLIADTAMGAYGVANSSCLGRDSETHSITQNLSTYLLTTAGAWLGILLASDSEGGRNRNFSLLVTAVPKAAMTGWAAANFAKNCK